MFEKLPARIAMVACILFPIVLCLIFFASEYLPFFDLSVKMCYMAVMQLFSLIFLMAFLQKPPFDLKWRIVCIVFSFITMGESWFIMVD